MNSQTMNNIHELMVTKQLQRRPLESNIAILTVYDYLI